MCGSEEDNLELVEKKTHPPLIAICSDVPLQLHARLEAWFECGVNKGPTVTPASTNCYPTYLLNNHQVANCIN